MPDPLTFSQIRAQHTAYLRRSGEGAPSPELVAELQNFVESARLAGQDIVDDDDRDYLRSLLTFWGNWLYNQTRTYPNTNLELFTPEAAAEHGRRVADKLAKGEALTDKQRKHLIVGGTLAAAGVACIFLVIGVLGTIAGAPMINPSPTALPMVNTVIAIATEIMVEMTSAPTEGSTLAPLETEIIERLTPEGTPMPSPTAEDGGNGPEPTPTATPTPISIGGEPTATVTRVSVRATGTPTPIGPPGFPTPDATATPEEGIGGGGDGQESSPVGIISVQVIEPQSGATVDVDQPLTLSATYFNLQTGWALFLVLTRTDTGDSVILPDSLAIREEGATGVMDAQMSVSTPGEYAVGVYIATSDEEIARLQRWADSGQIVTRETEYDGVILFRDLSVFTVS